jgi:hypothetical protein
MILVPDDGMLALRALAVAQQLTLGKAYDCLYAALAESRTCEFWTADERCCGAAHTTLPWVRRLGQLQVWLEHPGVMRVRPSLLRAEPRVTAVLRPGECRIPISVSQERSSAP